MKNRRTAKVLDRQIWWTFAFMKAASVAESGSNLCSASLASSALQQWFIGNPWEKVPWFQLGFVKKSSRLRTVKIKELIKCRQRWEGGGSSIKLEQEVVHPHWLMLTLACHGRPQPGREQHPNLIQLCLCTLVATNLQHICSSCTIPAKKIMCTANLI